MARQDLHTGSGSLKTSVFPHGLVARVFCACAILAMPAIAQAGQITISWDPDPAETTVGYKIHNAPNGQPFTKPIDAGNSSSFTITGLDPAFAYHAAISAYDIFGQESPLSAEVVYNPRPDSDTSGDADQDGLPDTLEVAGCTNPSDADTDDDGLVDGFEDADRNGARSASETDPCMADTDGDGLQDGTELGVTAALARAGTQLAVFRPDLDPATATDPLNADTDGDGHADGREDSNANGRVDSGETDPRLADAPLLFADDFSDGGKTGDPSWKKVRGSWSVTGPTKRYTSAKTSVGLALIADPVLDDFRSGRIESSVTLTRTYAKAANARIVFHYQDASHYRYVQLTEKGISIGQVGSNPVETAGVKATAKRKLKINATQRVRVDIAEGTEVRVHLNGEEVPALAHRFTVNSSGKVGYQTNKAKSFFDNAAAWTEFALQ
jgi:hypothetical protein